LFAHNTTIEILCDKRVRLNFLFRIEPSVAELGIESPISIGDLHTDSVTRLLFAFQVDNAVVPEEKIRLATGFIRSTSITEKGRKIRKNYKISVKIKDTPSHSSPPIVILNAISRITMYQMQEKVRREVQEGSIDQAVRHLESMATRMLIQGNQPLANIIIREADHISKERAFSSDGEKRIKYGTRALLQLPPPMKREE
jgi:Ca-activated chloride channel family protein